MSKSNRPVKVYIPKENAYKMMKCATVATVTKGYAQALATPLGLEVEEDISYSNQRARATITAEGDGQVELLQNLAARAVPKGQ